MATREHSIRAKMRCDSVEKSHAGTQAGSAGPTVQLFRELVKLQAVTGGSDENKQWSKYTPSGSLHLTIDNPGAQEFFEPGKEYFVDVTEA